MRPVDYIVIAIILVIVGAASYYIYRTKKSGRKCIGCPGGVSCKGCKGNCASHASSAFNTQPSNDSEK